MVLERGYLACGEHTGVGFVKTSQIFETQEVFPMEQNNSTKV